MLKPVQRATVGLESLPPALAGLCFLSDRSWGSLRFTPGFTLPPASRAFFLLALIHHQLTVLYRSNGIRLRIYHRTRSYFLCAFDDDRFARLRSMFDDLHRAATIGLLNGPDFDLVTPTPNGDRIYALQLRDGSLRHQQRLVVGTRHRADTSTLPGSQDIAGIWKNSRQPDGAGFLIHLPVREIETSFFRIGAAVRQDQFQFQPCHTCSLLRFDQICFGVP